MMMIFLNKSGILTAGLRAIISFATNRDAVEVLNNLRYNTIDFSQVLLSIDVKRCLRDCRS